ncbi:MAG: UTP--glucose-1-phosphate uridylyltransferase GalU [Nitriliruptorales bacterium]|nr:UTP--glucose-1-phosphate uridylyltransferase GalU [Nitriliruptorales bacterium]
MVTKAVLPVAGWGTRFLPATKAIPKEMIPVVDRPAIQYIVEECVEAGIDDVLLVTSTGKQSLVDHFDRVVDLEVALEEKGKKEELEEVVRLGRLASVHAVRQGEQLGLGHAVLMGREHVGDASFAVILGDDIIDPESDFLSRMIAVHERSGRPVVAVMEVPEDQVHLYGIVATEPTDEDDVFRATNLVEKPAADEAPSNLAIIGRYVLPAEIFDVIEQTPPGRGGEIQLTDALEAMAQDEPIMAVRFDGVRHDTGDKLGFLKATVEMAARREDLGPDFTAWLRTFVGEQLGE